MSSNGPLPNLMKEYTPAEREKFSKITDAMFAKNFALAKQLISELTTTEQARFKQYGADIAKIQAYQKQAQARIEQHEQKAAQLDSEISDLKNERAAVFSNGARAAVAQTKVEFRGTPTPGATPAPQGRVVPGLKY